jgi:hypothetical protein
MKKSKGSKILSKKKEPMQWCSRPNEENKNKEKEPKPNTGGHRGPFYNSNSKVQKCMSKNIWDTSTSDP